MWWHCKENSISNSMLWISLHTRTNNGISFGQWYRFGFSGTGLSLVERGADLNGSQFVCGLAESCSLHIQGNIVDTDTETCSLAIRWHICSPYIVKHHCNVHRNTALDSTLCNIMRDDKKPNQLVQHEMNTYTVLCNSMTGMCQPLDPSDILIIKCVW